MLKEGADDGMAGLAVGWFDGGKDSLCCVFKSTVGFHLLV